MPAEILPGILTHTYEEYVARLEMVEKSSAEWVHIDVMDGQFVPNITVMPHEIMGITTQLKQEAHLMTYQPERYFSDLTVAGVSRVLLHREAYDSLEECAKALKQAKDYFSEAGMVINIETPLESYAGIDMDVLLCMGVHPGASGQPIVDTIYDKLKQAKQENAVILEVDGGVHEDNIRRLQECGASRFVISSHLFVANNVATNLQHFSQILGGV